MHRRLLLCVSALALLIVPRVVSAADAGDPAEMAPKEALLFVGVTDAEDVWQRFEKTRGYKAMNDPTLKDSMAEFSMIGGVMDKFKQKLATALETSPSELKSPFAGPMAMYMSGEPGAEKPDVVFLGTIGDKALMDKYFETATNKLKAGATEAQVVEVGSNQLHVFKNTRAEGGNSNENSEDAEDDTDVDPSNPMAAIEKGMDELFSPESMPPELAICKTDKLLLVSLSESAAKRALQQNTDGSLARTDDYKAMDRLLSPVGPIRLVVNIPGIVEQARREAKEDAELQKVLQSLGVDAMRSFIGHAQLSGDGFESRMEGLLLMTGERAGLAKLLSMKNRAVAPPASVGADHVAYMSLNLNPPAMLEEVERMVRQNDPAAADQMRQMLESAPLGQNPVNLRKELIDNLSDPFTFGLDLRKPYVPEEVRMLATIGAKSREPIAALLSQIPIFVQRDLRGNTVFDAAMVAMSIAPTSERILIGTAAAIDSALSGESGSALADTATFQKAARHVQSEAWGVFYMDERRMTEAVMEYRKDEAALAASTNPGAQMVAAMGEAMLGQGKSPEAARTLMQYQGASLMTITDSADGLRFVLVAVAGD